jgi:hypothetical protein
MLQNWNRGAGRSDQVTECPVRTNFWIQYNLTFHARQVQSICILFAGQLKIGSENDLEVFLLANKNTHGLYEVSCSADRMADQI